MDFKFSYFSVDNSEYMRNTDYAPSRMEAQCAAVYLTLEAKSSKNPENTAGLVKMAPPEALSSCTSDFGTILRLIDRLKIEGESRLLPALQIAQVFEVSIARLDTRDNSSS